MISVNPLYHIEKESSCYLFECGVRASRKATHLTHLLLPQHKHNSVTMQYRQPEAITATKHSVTQCNISLCIGVNQCITSVMIHMTSVYVTFFCYDQLFML